MNNSGVECGAMKEMAEKIVNAGGNLALKIQPEHLIRETCVRAGETVRRAYAVYIINAY